MIQGSDDLISQIGKISATLGAAQLAIARVLEAVVGQDDALLDASKLRDFGHGLVALGGDLTSFGVEMARRSDELS